MPRTAALLVVLVAAPLAACGIKGPLKPPGNATAGAPTAATSAADTLPSEAPTSVDPQRGEVKP
ncbi:MAG: lipoprotein [Betaproteobacteria bacterium]